MSAEDTLLNVKLWCVDSSGNEQVWVNKGTTYQWSRGKTTTSGVLNGVVRKLAGIDASGKQIWVVAGSLKINADGTISRFTGIPKALQKLFCKTSTYTTNPAAEAIVV